MPDDCAWRAARALVALVTFQIALGLTAYLVTLDGAGMLQPGTGQVIVNTTHAVMGAVLTAATVAAVLTIPRPARPEAPGDAS